uniref:Neuronal growth regulator 1 n=1 Tax=Molossus molossus TaxID=27622 RepID=A0A7J8FA14_MOLMO|nr:neuronal growth regulator 1 [Molossus molossus]
MMLLVQGACCSNQWLAAVLLSLCCLLPSCLPAGQSVDFPWAAVDNMMVRKGDTAVLRCYLEDGASKGAWLNRSSIIFAGGDKWSVDPRVSISTLNKRDYSLQIQNVDVTDDGPYTCSVQTQHTPRTMQVHLTVQEIIADSKSPLFNIIGEYGRFQQSPYLFRDYPKIPESRSLSSFKS